MKNFKSLLLMICTTSFFGLQAMGPDYGDFKRRGKKCPFSISSTEQENRNFLFDEEHTLLLERELYQKRNATLKKQMENEILEDFKKFNASVQESNTENRNNKPTEDNQFTDDENEEIARFAAAYRAHKEEKALNKPSIKKNVHFCLPDNPNTEKTPSRKNRTNHQFAALCIGTKQQRHTESPIAQLVAAGKESPFSETTSPSLSPTHVEVELSDAEVTEQEDNMFFMEQ